MPRPEEEPTLPPTSAPADPDATLPPPADPDTTLPTGSNASPDGRAPAGYAIEKELGRGGMGVVYLARSVALRRTCALKVILAGAHSGADEVARFRAEALAIARVQHPGIVQVFEIGEHDGKPFMALEYRPGGALDAVLAKNPLPAREAAALVRSLAEAMHAAHAADVIHRDLKPANILLTDQGQPKITDFGLAKRLDEEGATRTGSVMGTPSYMPPEQADGKKDIGPAADIYALGAILYECLAGRPPFRAATALDTVLQVITEEPVPLRQLNAKVPIDLETIAHKCLQKDPARRYASSQALADDLGRYLDGEPIRARPVGAIERGVKWVKRNGVVSALAACVLLALTAGVVVSGFFAVSASNEASAARKAEADVRAEKVRADGEAEEAKKQKVRADEKADEAQKQVERAEAEKAKAEDQLRKAEWLVYAGKLSLAQSAFAENKVALAQEYLDECQWDLRGWEHRHLRTRFGGKQRLVGHTLPVSSVAWSPDGKRLLTGSHDGTAKVWDAQAGTEALTLKGHTQDVFDVAFSPDGKHVLTGSADKTARVWDAEIGAVKATLTDHTNSVVRVAYSPDGRRILTGGSDKTAKVWDAEKGTELLALKGHTSFVTSVEYSPDGRHILTGSSDHTAKVWDAEKGAEVFALKGHTDAVLSVTYSPDGTRILTGSNDRTAKVWDADKGTEVLLLKGHTSGVSSVAFSPDGRRILTGGMDHTAKLWDAEKGTELLALKGHADYVGSVAFSPDTKKVFTWDAVGKVLAWDVANGQPIAPDNPPARPAPGSAISPDGRLSAKPERGLVRLIDLLQPAPVGTPWPLPDAAQRKAHHTEQAALADKESKWFAVAFHVGRLLLDDPDNAELKKRRDEALRKHRDGRP